MAISSVARKATIRKDDSIQKAMAIVGRQQALRGRLALEQRKLEQAAIKDKNIELGKQFKTLREIDSENSLWAPDFEVKRDQVETDLINPDISFQQKELSLSDLDQFAAQTGVAHSAMIKARDDRAGNAEQQKFRNLEEISKASVNYVMDSETGKAIDPVDFNEQKLNDVLDNNLKTYNQPNIVQGFMDQQTEVVATDISSKNLASGFSRNEIIKQAGKFMVLNEDGSRLQYDKETGKPTTNLTGESLAAFEGYSKANTLAIDEFLTKPANKDKNRLDGMKDILEKNGHLTIEETREVKLQPTPKPRVPSGPEQQIVNINRRIDFFDESIDTGGEKILRQLRTAKGVVANDTGENKTGIKTIPGGLQFTIVQDPSKVLEIPRTYLTASGEEVEYVSLKPKGEKFIVTKIDILNADRLPGMIELSAKFDQTVGSKFEIDPVEFVELYQKKHANDVVDLFGGELKDNERPLKGKL